MLWTAANRTLFTICRTDGQVVWRGSFGTVLPSAGAAAEAAARQAIWLAGYARTDWGADAATLHLGLTTDHDVDIDALERHAFALGLVLDLITAPTDNPASAQRNIKKLVDWRGIDLGALIQSG